MGSGSGRELWTRYERLVGVRVHHLDAADKWFDRYGEVTVFVSRVLPVLRTFIAFPANITRMSLVKFTAYTIAGYVPWMFALTYAGYLLLENQENIGTMLHYLDYAVAAVLGVGAVYLLWRYFRPSET